MEIIQIIILSLSALLLVFVGSMRLLNPVQTFRKSSGIHLADDVDLLNEIRGLSALMLCGGLITALGIFLPDFRFTSFVVATLIFLGFFLGRMLSIAKDGKPNKQIRQGIGFELILGSANVLALILV